MLTSYRLIEYEALAHRHELLREAALARLAKQARPEAPRRSQTFQRWLVGLYGALLSGQRALDRASARSRHVPSRKRSVTLTRSHRRGPARPAGKR